MSIALAALFAVTNAGCDQLFAYRSGPPLDLDRGGDTTRDGDIGVGDTTRDGDIGVGDTTRDGDIGAADTTRDGDIGAADSTHDGITDGPLPPDGTVDFSVDVGAVDLSQPDSAIDGAPTETCPPSRTFSSLTTGEAIALALDGQGRPYIFWAHSSGPLRFSQGQGTGWTSTATAGAATNGALAIAAARDSTHVHALYANSTSGGFVSVLPATQQANGALLFNRAPADAVHLALGDAPGYVGGAVLFVQGSATTVTYVRRTGTLGPTQCSIGEIAKLELPSAVVALNGWIGVSYYDPGSVSSVRLADPTKMCLVQRGPASATPGQGFIVMAQRGASIEAMHVAGSSTSVQRQVLPQGATFPSKLTFSNAGLSTTSAAKRNGIALTTDELGRVVALHSDGAQIRVATMATTGNWTVNPGPAIASTASVDIRLLVKAAASRVHAIVVDRSAKSATYYCAAY